MGQPAQPKPRIDIGRRAILSAAGGLAAATAVGGVLTGQASAAPSPDTAKTGRRRLGSLEVSSLGLGVQNMSRTYQTTIPSRPEMISIIRAAFDRDVTFFDAAEAYGPVEAPPKS